MNKIIFQALHSSQHSLVRCLAISKYISACLAKVLLVFWMVLSYSRLDIFTKVTCKRAMVIKVRRNSVILAIGK